MTIGRSFSALLVVLLGGCGSSLNDGEKTQQRAEELDSKVVLLTKEVEELQSIVRSKDKEIDELKNGSSRLLAQAKAAGADQEVITLLKELLSRHPVSPEAEEARLLLQKAEERLSEAELISRKSRSAKETCIVDGQKLAPMFAGTDLPKVLKEFGGIGEKDEFESTTSYRTRLAKEIEGAGSLTQCAVIEGNWHTKYDADAQKWTIGLNGFAEYTTPERTFQFRTGTRELSNDNYTGSNAFGVTKEINRTKHLAHGVAFPERSFTRAMRKIGAKEGVLEYIINIPMIPEMAKTIDKKDVRVLIQYKWIPDYVVRDTTHHSATIGAPWEDETKVEMILGDPISVLVFNQRNGEVLMMKSAR